MQEAQNRSAARTYTRRQFLEYTAIVNGAPWWIAKEAVASTAIEHPEWDMDQQMTWAEWEALPDMQRIPAQGDAS